MEASKKDQGDYPHYYLGKSGVIKRVSEAMYSDHDPSKGRGSNQFIIRGGITGILINGPESPEKRSLIEYREGVKKALRVISVEELYRIHEEIEKMELSDGEKVELKEIIWKMTKQELTREKTEKLNVKLRTLAHAMVHYFVPYN